MKKSILPRAHAICEAVLTVFGPRMSEKDLNFFLEDVREVLLRWFKQTKHRVPILIRSLNNLPSATALRIHFLPSPSLETVRLWGGAMYNDMSNVIEIDVNLNFDSTHATYPGGTPLRHIYVISEHIHSLREQIIEELLHHQRGGVTKKQHIHRLSI